jgi:hypothetical protein
MGQKTPDEIAYFQRGTRQVLAGGSQLHKIKSNCDWIGCRWTSGASKINRMLIDGATWEQLSQARGAVDQHLRFLSEHGLPVVCCSGVYMFDREELGVGPPKFTAARQLAKLTSLNAARAAPPQRTSTDNLGAKNRLVAVVGALATQKRAELDRHKEGQSGLDRPDFIWHYLLQSFATMGRASGWHGLIGNQENYRRVTYSALSMLTFDARTTQVRQVCRVAGIRMPDRKADFILSCFDYVTRLGGPEAAKAKLLAQPGREAKIEFLKKFPGIGDKYARNIMMDVYHPDFRDSIAVDARINAISNALGLSFASYRDHEAFYLDVAKEAGLNGWELDRLLFNFRTEVESRLGVTAGRSV